MFRTKEQNLNEQTVEITELKKKQMVFIIDIRVIIFQQSKHRLQPQRQLFRYRFRFYLFEFITERKEIFPKLPTYYGIKKIQPWYIKVQAKLEMDFIHLS